MKNFKNNHKRNRFRSNGDRNYKRNGIHQKISIDFSNGTDFRRKNPGRNNQNAHKLFEKYTELAREALSNGDKILSENYFQHAEHFIRVLGEKENLNNKNQMSKDIKKNGDELAENKINQEEKNSNNIENISAE